MENTKSETIYENQSLALYYEEAIKVHELGAYSIGQIVSADYALKFIKEHFQEELKNKKIRACLELITPFRAVHTVSAFLLGLTIRDKLQFDTRNWRRLPGAKSARGSFDLFWSWICLFHDVGYYYEDNPKKFSDIRSLDGLIERLGLKHNLLKVSEHKKLIEKYFNKRLMGSARVLDHGIVGAVLLYDALMDLSNNSMVYSRIKRYEFFYAKICDTIALHNMWRATEATMEEYREYNLNELIPENNCHIIYYKDNPVLYLLALVDSIDPIKGFCRDRRHRRAISMPYVVDNVYLKFICYSGMKQILIHFDDPVFSEYAEMLLDPECGLTSWLGTYVNYSQTKSGNRIVKISIDLYNSNMLQGISA